MAESKKQKKRVASKQEQPAKDAPKICGNNKLLIAAGVLVVLIVVFSLVALFALPKQGTTPASASNTVKLELFVRGLDSNAQDAEITLKPILEKFGPNVSLKMYFIVAYADYGFQAAGGKEEVAEDALQACAQAKYPENFFDFVACRANGIDGRTCGKQTGVDFDVASVCAETEEGKKLLEESFRFVVALNILPQYSPTLYVNTSLLQKPITTTSVMQAVCALIPTHSACQQIPTCSADFECASPTEIGKCTDAGTISARCEYTRPKQVNLTVFTDSKCGACNSEPVISVLSGMFKGLNVSTVDSSTDAGSRRVQYFGFTGLPAFVFDKSIEQGEGFNAIKSDLYELGDFYVLNQDVLFKDKVGRAIASTLPVEMVKREEKNASLTLFAMGSCPYLPLSSAILSDVVGALPKVSLDVRFVVGKYDNGSVFAASPEELNEDKRMACILEKGTQYFLNYSLCRSSQLAAGNSTEWQECLAGVPENNSIVDCANGAGVESRLALDADFVGLLGIRGSPALLLNNRIILRDIPAPDKLKQWVCLANSGLAGCDVGQLSNETVLKSNMKCLIS